MPRPREFDDDQTLERVMRTFWQHGYKNTSIEHLAADPRRRPPRRRAPLLRADGPPARRPRTRASGGHFVHRESPDEVTAAIVEFLLAP
jgi:pimeloyl-ACP methyl ester carboxylesterase